MVLKTNHMIPPVLAHIKSLGHVIFDDPKYDYDLNIFGIRNKNGKTNSFDDLMGCIYLWDGEWRSHYWRATVDPGLYWLENPMNVKGTAVLCPGQYRGAYEIGEHKGKAALVQVGPVKVWRDPNRDKSIDTWGEPDEGFFGINIHRAGKSSKLVNRWSAGCQVFANTSDFESFMENCDLQTKLTGFKTFSYTLLDQWW